MTAQRGDGHSVTPLWAQEELSGATSRSSGKNRGEATSRDPESMKAEIKELQQGTTQSLDRAIAAAQAASSVGTHITEDLQEQREQMGRIDADVREMDGTLKHTGYNLKYGFNWRGALTSPFRKAVKNPGAVRDVSPVFTDGYTSGKIPPKSPASKNGTTSSRENSTPTRGRLFGSGKRQGAGKSPTRGSQGESSSGTMSKPPSAGHAPEGFDNQLDILDGLVEGLAVQAQAIGDELRQQNEGIEVLGERVEPVMAQTESQSKQIKRRFKVRG